MATVAALWWQESENQWRTRAPSTLVALSLLDRLSVWKQQQDDKVQRFHPAVDSGAPEAVGFGLFLLVNE